MKLPNGYGSVYKLKGNRRKPFIAKITEGWTEEGKQIKKAIGYYETKKEALEALALYHQNPAMIDNQKVTFKDIFDKWSIKHYEGLSHQAVTAYNSAFKHCAVLHDTPFKDIKTNMVEDVILKSSEHHATRKCVKNLFSQMFKFAMENDVVDKNYASFVKIKHDKEAVIKRQIFKKDEIDRLFEMVNDIDFIDTILIMIYSGIRVGELLSIKNKDVNLEEKYFRCGIKTEAGKNRLIPINEKILPFFKARYNPESEYLIVNKFGDQMKYSNYIREKFDKIMEQLKMNHNPHDCRHTFATLMYEADANKTSITRLIGHNSYVVTEKVYTHSEIEDLKKAVDLI